MAYKDSNEIAPNSSYALGEYSFRIERSSVPGSTNDKIEAICTKDGKNARKSIQIPSSDNLAGWYVEANGTEATVYATIENGEATCIGPTASAGTLFATGHWGYEDRTWICTRADRPVLAGVCHLTEGDWDTAILIGTGSSNVAGKYTWSSASSPPGEMALGIAATAIINNTGFKLVSGGGIHPNSRDGVWGVNLGTFSNYNEALQRLVAQYFRFGGEFETVMVGRFAIDLEDAGGDGPGSDWTDPGDYDPDWEPDDPTHTLYVTVAGALSGRHNDPIEDPSYSYIPSDKDTVKGYGCGGDGGHGGGGGAGASTVVIHKFATNQANSKEVTAIARRHGYGSGGGKGGKGGDGCILVYY